MSIINWFRSQYLEYKKRFLVLKKLNEIVSDISEERFSQVFFYNELEKIKDEVEISDLTDIEKELFQTKITTKEEANLLINKLETLLESKQMSTLGLKILENQRNNTLGCIRYTVLPNDILNLLKKKVDHTQFSINIPEYTNFIENTFFSGLKFEKSVTQIREINSLRKINSQKLHREFQEPTEHSQLLNYNYLVICYLKLDNCTPEDCGLGIQYTSKSNEIKTVILPAFEGIVFMVRDSCLYHFTPQLEPQNKSTPVIRILIRDYYRVNGYGFEESFFQKIDDKKI